jgi:signal transduction histidine kinase
MRIMPPLFVSSLHLRWLLTAKVAIAIALSFAVDMAMAAQAQKEVLVLYSTRRDAQIVTVGDRELPRILEKGLSEGVDYYSEFIDEGRFSQPDYQIAFRDFIASKYRGLQLELVIAMGQKPLEFVITHRNVLFAGAPIVYFADTDDPVPNFPNATGVVAKANLAGTVALATALQPDTQNVFVVIGVGADAFLESARRQLRAFEPRLSITYLAGLPTADLEARLTKLPPRSIVYYLVVDRDGAGERFHPLEYLSRLTPITNAPVYSWVDSAMDRGIVGGSLKDQVAQAQAVGQLAVRVLSAGSAEGIPPVIEDLNVTQVDSRQLQRWRISESRVPPGTVIRFKEPTMWDRYAPFIIIAALVVFAQSVLIGGLLLQHNRRRQAEAELLRNQDELRRSYDRIRDLGARLLNAQESERSRVARDLHDDISQQMALLEIDLEQLAGVVEEGEAETLTHETLQRAQEIGRSVHELSHRLHPAKLRLIGLVPALQGLRRELSQQEIEIKFTHENVPASLPEELSLCLFRIVQEALNNAIKYSKGRHVTVDLRGGQSWLKLTIVDDGVGFDVNTTWRKGLGLLSMHERLEAVGGSLEIHSKPGAGTRLEVAVPLSLDPVVAA